MRVRNLLGIAIVATVLLPAVASADEGPRRSRGGPSLERFRSRDRGGSASSRGDFGRMMEGRRRSQPVVEPRVPSHTPRVSRAPWANNPTPRALGPSATGLQNRARVNAPTQPTLGPSGDALARYRAAIEQARDRSRGRMEPREQAFGGGPGSLSPNSALLDRFRRRTPPSSPGATLGGSLDRPARNGGAGTPQVSRRLESSGRLGSDADLTAGPLRRRTTDGATSSSALSDRLRLRRAGDGTAATRVDPSRTFGDGSRLSSTRLASSRLSSRRATSYSHLDGHDHASGYTHRYLSSGSHHHHGHVHHHHDGGFFVSWWNPWHYRHYGSYWLGGLPAFGFGISYYEPYYAPYFDPGVVVIEQPYPVYVQQPVVVEQAPVYGQPPAYGVPVAPSAPTPAPVAPAAGDELPTPSADEGDAAKQAFETGLRAFAEQRYEQALGMFRLVTDLDPANGEAWLGRAHASLALGQYADAAAAVAESAELGAFPRGYRFDPRPVYKAPGAFDAAFARLTAYAKGNPQDPDAQMLLAWLHVGLGEHEKAKAHLDALKALRADDPTAVFLRAAMLPPEPPPQSGAAQDRPPAGPAGAPPAGAGVIEPPPVVPGPSAPR